VAERPLAEVFQMEPKTRVAAKEVAPPFSPATAPKVGRGSLGEALRVLQKQVSFGRQTFVYPDDLGEGDITFSIDTHGIDLTQWVRRFGASVRENWITLSSRGTVVINFTIDRLGHISNIDVAEPSRAQALTDNASRALQRADRRVQLPPEYPSDSADITATFHYGPH